MSRRRVRVGDRARRGTIALKEGQIHDDEARPGIEFEDGAYGWAREDRRDRLELGLSEHPPEGLASVAELAAKIKALRESVTVGAAPEQTARKAARGERPATARIRERQKAEPVAPVVEEKQEPDLVEPPAVVIPMPEPIKPVADFRQTVAKRRQGDGRQLSLF